MLRGFIFVTGAFVLDVLQAVIFYSVVGISWAGGGLLQFIPIVGTVAGAAIAQGGYVAADVIDVALSFGFGTLLVTLLIYAKMFYPAAFFGTSLIEILLPFLPGWTALAWRCSYNKYQEEKAEKAQLATNAQPA
jgi:hypothetical protein